MFDTLQQRVTQWWATQQKISDVSKIDPSIIATIIQVIMSMITGCIPMNTPSQMHDIITKQPVKSRVMIWLAARKSGVTNRSDVNDIVECIYTMGKQATADEIKKLMDESIDLHV